MTAHRNSRARDSARAASQAVMAGLLSGQSWFGSTPAPVVLQEEAAECGLACLTMIAAHHGHDVDLAILRSRFGVSIKGATLGYVLSCANSLGLASRPVRTELEALNQLQTPCILHWDMNHFVVLRKVSGRGLVIHDPAVGERRLTLAEASRHFTGVAVEISPSGGFERKVERRALTLRQMIGRLIGARRAVLQLVGLSLALELCVLILPAFMQIVVDNVAKTGDLSLLATLVMGFGLLLLVQHSISWLRAWVILHVGTTINLQWQSNVFMHLLRLPMNFFERRHVGDIVSRFDSVQEIQRTVTNHAVQALIDGILSVTTLIVMLLYAPWLAVVSIVAVAMYATLRLVTMRPLMAANQETIVHGARQQTHFLETVRGARAIKLFDNADDRRIAWLNLLIAQTNAGVVRDRLNIAFGELSGLIFGFERLIVIAIAATLVIDAKFTIGALYAYLTYKDQFAARIATLIDTVIQFRTLRVHLDRLADIVSTEPEVVDPVGEQSYGERAPLAATLSLRNVTYSYAPSEPPVLYGVNLDVMAGESVAIVGPSGSGKTTLLKLMAGLMSPEQGQVLVGGVPIETVGLRRFRNMIGTVMQDDQLLAGSIADNICFFDLERDMKWLVECATMAAIHDDIQAMPMRYDTLIGDLGAAVSGGQKQRIVLARALYKRPKILLLDEATSHLDVALEKAVNAVIASLNITRVIVAHRPETIASADRVIPLQTLQISQDRSAVSV